MKTAMQELIEEIVEHLTYDDSLSEDSRVTYETIRLRCISKLEKEKEQIIEFCYECLKGDNIHTITSNKELIEYINNRYNQTYDQNE